MKLSLYNFEGTVVNGIDISWYAKPEYTWAEMEQIRTALEKNQEGV